MSLILALGLVYACIAALIGLAVWQYRRDPWGEDPAASVLQVTLAIVFWPVALAAFTLMAVVLADIDA